MSLYTSTQKFLRLGFKLFYRRVHIINLHHVPVSGPVLLVSNHPNSFMDALVIGSYLPRTTNFLARGDAFKNPLLAKIFKAYHMLPVYRAREGKENIEKNFETFDASYEAVNNGECMLIFGEGLSINNWQLRPLKKGPARIASRAWQSDGMAKDLAIIPVGLTYSHYKGADKSVIINYGTPITKHDLINELDSPGFTKQLNDIIAAQLKQLAYFNNELTGDISLNNLFKQGFKQAEAVNKNVIAVLNSGNLSADKHAVRNTLFNKINSTIITIPHYWLSRFITQKLTKGTVFYDSVLFILFWFLMPLYLIVIVILLICFG